MKIDEQTLMAFADGQLDPAQAARVAAAVASDPRLAESLARHRALAGALRDAYSGVLEEPVPPHLQALLTGAGPVEGGRAAVARIEVARASRQARTFGPPAWIAMAAALVLGLAIGALLGRGDDDLRPGADGRLVAQGELAHALETALAAEPSGPVAIGLSFRADDGRWCRSFVREGEVALAGLACRDARGSWQVPVLGETTVAAGELRQAAAALPPAVLAEVDARLAGEPADAAQERAARDAGWR